MRLPLIGRLFRPRRVAQTETANSADTPENAHLWRSLRDGTRDLPAVERDHAIETAARLIERDGIASRMTQQIREWCVGDGVTFSATAKDQAHREAQQEALDAIFREPQTCWAEFAGQIAETLAPMGELLTTDNPPPSGKGVTAFGVVDPSRIQAVLVNPNNARQTVGVLLKPTAGGHVPAFYPAASFREWAAENQPGAAAAGFSKMPKMGDIIDLPGGAFGTMKAKVGPDCDYFPWRRRLGATRGLSMFFSVADLITDLDRSIVQQVEGVAARNAWAVWIKATGSTPKEAQEIAKKAAAQMGKGGGHFGTNEQVTAEVLAPDLGAHSFDKHLETMMKILSAETGWPVTWLGLGTEAGNSATTELAGPAMKMMKFHQGEIARVIHTLVTRAMRRMPRPAGMSEEEWLDFDILLPEVGGRDMVRDSAALAQGTVAVDAGLAQGAFTTEKGGEITRMLFNKFLSVEFAAEDIPEAPEEIPETGAGDTDVPPKDDEDPDEDEAKRDADDLARAREQGRKARQSRKVRAGR